MEFGIFIIIIQLAWLIARVGDVRDILHAIYRMQKETNKGCKKC